MIISNSINTKNLVLGLGKTGLSVARYLKRNNINATYFDTRNNPPGASELVKISPKAKLLLGDIKLTKDIDRIIVSPGISDRYPLLVKARNEDIEIISDIELFTQVVSIPFVAITGSNGKSTVTTLLNQMCLADGLSAAAGGNLGEPALDLLIKEKSEIYILELSSFQLQRTFRLPAKISILLNVTPDHLDWHTDESEYRRAKYRVFREAKFAVFNRADDKAFEYVKHCSRSISFGLDCPKDKQYGLRTYNDEAYLAHGKSILMPVAKLGTQGIHNQLNALAALAAGDLLGLSISAMLKVLKEFSGLPHRMQYVAQIKNVNYINDSKATNVAASIASIKSIKSKLILIAGGDGKGGNFSDIGIVVKDKLRGAILIGKDAKNIAKAIGTEVPVFFADSMRDAVNKAAGYAKHHDTVLLSPACASFDQYNNYAERGESFCSAVEALK
ncbi:MAG: UDP-N-acetylmuramoyl-L-alanine--D-glutamate ligase [Gammaproteobacteria bacterium]|nr:UDP-N-acetylmuramoyl-L-alanine--D-glutamate ligase [Gammaproteobacteria bacterium]|tara:strand:+ start:4146 stop:5480 length:1335 start_codon:yes stop_codon:yes gene_type:complete